MGDTLSKWNPFTQNQHEDLPMLDQPDNQFMLNHCKNIMLEVTLLNKTISLEVQRLNTVMEVKRLIYDKEDIPIENQILVHDRCVLNNSFTLCDYYDIEDEATLDLFLDHDAIQNNIHTTKQVGAQMTIRLHMGSEIFYVNISPLCLVKELEYKVECCYRRDMVGYNPIHDHKVMCMFGLHLYFDNRQMVPNENNTLSDYNIKDGNSVYVHWLLFGAGHFRDCLSHCPQCEGDLCVIVENCNNRNFVKVKYASEYPWLALCNVFNISREVKQKIQDNSEDTGIRCLDVLHHIFHADLTQTWTTVKLKLSSQYPELAREI